MYLGIVYAIASIGILGFIVWSYSLAFIDSVILFTLCFFLFPILFYYRSNLIHYGLIVFYLIFGQKIKFYYFVRFIIFILSLNFLFELNTIYCLDERTKASVDRTKHIEVVNPDIANNSSQNDSKFVWFYTSLDWIHSMVMSTEVQYSTTMYTLYRRLSDIDVANNIAQYILLSRAVTLTISWVTTKVRRSSNNTSDTSYIREMHDNVIRWLYGKNVSNIDIPIVSGNNVTNNNNRVAETAKTTTNSNNIVLDYIRTLKNMVSDTIAQAWYWFTDTIAQAEYWFTNTISQTQYWFTDTISHARSYTSNAIAKGDYLSFKTFTEHYLESSSLVEIIHSTLSLVILVFVYLVVLNIYRYLTEGANKKK